MSGSRSFYSGVSMLTVGASLAGYFVIQGHQTASAQALVPQGEPSARAQIQLSQFTPEMIAQAERLAKVRAPEGSLPEAKPADVPPLSTNDVKTQVATTPAPVNTTPPAPAAPSVEVQKPADISTPAPQSPEISRLTGKDLIKAPLSAKIPANDMGIAEKLREILAAQRYDKIVDRKDDRSGLEAFYRDRGFAPLWIENGSESARAVAAAKYIEGVGADALYPQDYPVPNFKASDAAGLAEAELKLTNSILDYTRHAQTGRMHFTRLDGDIHFDLQLPDPKDTLSKIADASPSGVSAVLDSYSPQHPQYKALKAKLAEVRNQAVEAEVARIPDGPTLKVGMDDKRVPLLRKRLGVTNETDTKYDKTVADAVAAFQKKSGLNPDGVAGPGTIKAINGPARANRLDTIMVNMERWRWVPRDLGEKYVMVNIPDFTLKVVNGGEKVWETRIVVGKPSQATPIMNAEMSHITVNPTWNVPPSIIAKEYLPALQQDSQAMTRIGLKVETNKDGTVRIYQPPGESNALGRIRFNFPNKFLVYQHDTPDKKLFAHDKRAYSHGCMRVQDPAKYAEVLLGIALPNEKYSEAKVRSMFGSQEITINFPKKLPVHLTYQTAFVDDSGQIVFRDDVYGRDAQMIGIMKENSRKVADVAVPKRIASYSRDELRLPNGMSFGGNNDFSNFFRKMFGR